MGGEDKWIFYIDGTRTSSCRYDNQTIAEHKAKGPFARAWFAFCSLFRGSYVQPDPFELQS